MKLDKKRKKKKKKKLWCSLKSYFLDFALEIKKSIVGKSSD